MARTKLTCRRAIPTNESKVRSKLTTKQFVGMKRSRSPRSDSDEDGEDGKDEVMSRNVVFVQYYDEWETASPSVIVDIGQTQEMTTQAARDFQTAIVICINNHQQRVKKARLDGVPGDRPLPMVAISPDSIRDMPGLMIHEDDEERFNLLGAYLANLHNRDAEGVCTCPEARNRLHAQDTLVGEVVIISEEALATWAPSEMARSSLGVSDPWAVTWG